MISVCCLRASPLPLPVRPAGALSCPRREWRCDPSGAGPGSRPWQARITCTPCRVDLCLADREPSLLWRTVSEGACFSPNSCGVPSTSMWVTLTPSFSSSAFASALSRLVLLRRHAASTSAVKRVPSAATATRRAGKDQNWQLYRARNGDLGRAPASVLERGDGRPRLRALHTELFHDFPHDLFRSLWNVVSFQI